jgi:DNA polymerase II large subunit
MKKKGVSSAVKITIVAVLTTTISIALIAVDISRTNYVTLGELNQDFDNNTFKFRSYDPGDVVQVKDTVENVILVTPDELRYYPENMFEKTYEISFPVTLITMVSAENMRGQGAFWAIALEGDRRGEYNIGQMAIIPIHIEKVLGTEIAREAYTGTMIWLFAGFPLGS